MEKLSNYIFDYWRIFPWIWCIWREHKLKERTITKCLTIWGYPHHFKPVIPSVLIYVHIAITHNSEIPVEPWSSEDVAGFSLKCLWFVSVGPEHEDSWTLWLSARSGYPTLWLRKHPSSECLHFVSFCQILLRDFHTLKMAVLWLIFNINLNKFGNCTIC